MKLAHLCYVKLPTASVFFFKEGNHIFWQSGSCFLQCPISLTENWSFNHCCSTSLSPCEWYFQTGLSDLQPNREDGVTPMTLERPKPPE